MYMTHNSTRKPIPALKIGAPCHIFEILRRMRESLGRRMGENEVGTQTLLPLLFGAMSE